MPHIALGLSLIIGIVTFVLWIPHLFMIRRGVAVLSGGLVCLWLIATPGLASTVSFEDLPEMYFFGAADRNIGTFYSGLTFGPDITALSVSRFGGYNNLAFSPHSGDVVIWSASDPELNVSFSAPQTSVSLWYTSLDPVNVTAFDSSGNILQTLLASPNTDGVLGTSSSVMLSSTNITSVSLVASPGLFVVDDLTYTPVPEPSGTLPIVCLGCALVLLGRRGRWSVVRAARRKGFSCLWQHRKSSRFDCE